MRLPRTAEASLAHARSTSRRRCRGLSSLMLTSWRLAPGGCVKSLGQPGDSRSPVGSRNAADPAGTSSPSRPTDSYPRDTHSIATASVFLTARPPASSRCRRAFLGYSAGLSQHVVCDIARVWSTRTRRFASRPSLCRDAGSEHVVEAGDTICREMRSRSPNRKVAETFPCRSECAGNEVVRMGHERRKSRGGPQRGLTDVAPPHNNICGESTPRR